MPSIDGFQTRKTQDVLGATYASEAWKGSTELSHSTLRVTRVIGILVSRTSLRQSLCGAR